MPGGPVLPPVKGLWTVEERLGGWQKAQDKFFGDQARPACRTPPAC